MNGPFRPLHSCVACAIPSLPVLVTRQANVAREVASQNRSARREEGDAPLDLGIHPDDGELPASLAEISRAVSALRRLLGHRLAGRDDTLTTRCEKAN